MEGGAVNPEELLAKLKLEQDWNLSCIFTDKEKVVADNGCNLQADEIK